MKYFLFVAIVINLISCNQSHINQSSQLSFSQSNATIDETGNIYDFGSMTNKTAAITQVYKFKNVSGVKMTEAPVATISGDSGFSIILQSGCTQPLSPNGTCQVRVMFNPSGKVSGTYNASLKIGNSPISNPSLTATVVDAPPPVIPVGVDNYYDETSTLLSGSLNLGVFSKTQSITKIVTIKNDSTSSVTGTATASNSTDFSILNQCVKTLAAGKSCTVRITFSGAGKTDGSSYSTKITFANVDLNVTASILGTPPTNYNISILDGTTDVTNSIINLGDLQQTDSITKTITIKNIGAGAATLASASESDNTNFSYIDQCQNKTLAAGSSCTVRATLSAKGKTGSYSTIISFLGKTVTINGNVLTADVITYSPTYSSYGSCSAQICDGQGFQSRTIIKCTKVTNGVAGATVDNSFCSSFATNANLQQSCQSPAGDLSIPIDNGTKIVSCSIGSTVQTYKSLSCTQPFVADNATKTCIQSQASTYVGNVMMFIATNPSVGYELMRYDPISDKVTVIDHFPGSANGVDPNMRMARINGELYLYEAADHKMLKYNDGTGLLTTFANAPGGGMFYLPAACNNRLFVMNFLNSAFKTYRYDPSLDSGLTEIGGAFAWDPACTTEQNSSAVTAPNGDIYDINSSTNKLTKNGVDINNTFNFSRFDSKLVMVNDVIYFAARSAIQPTYTALFKYDVISNQFSLVVDAAPNYGIGSNIAALQNKIFLTKGTVANGDELYIYDTTTNTVKLYDIYPGSGNSYTAHPVGFMAL